MFRNKTLGIAAAAALGLAAMLGSTAAHAIKICDDTAPTGRDALGGTGCADSVTYAAETLLMGDGNVQAAKDMSDTTVYHNITDTVLLAVPADVGASSGDAYIVRVTLDGMVFQSAASLAGGTDTTYAVVSGGAAGDDHVVFRMTSGSINAASDNLSLNGNYAVSAAGGSAELTMTNQTVEGLGIRGVTGTATHSGSPIKVAAALNEMSTKMNPEADVAADGFMEFLNDRTTAAVGSLMVGVKAMRRLASDGNEVDAGGDVPTSLGRIMDTGTDATVDPNVPNSAVAFSGDFSFASSVFLHGDDDCGAASSDSHVANPNTDDDEASAEVDLRMMEGEVVQGTTMSVNVTTFATVQYLCIMVDPTVDDAMRIPATSAYTALGSYDGIANAAIGPMPEEQILGMIGRNGTTVHLPYLTTNDKFHQRIRLVNRSSAPVRYEMEFHGAGDEAGMDAEGMLDANSIKVLSLDNDDVVTPASGGKSTSGSLIIEAQPSMIDVATTLVTRATGASDTVVYSAE